MDHDHTHEHGHDHGHHGHDHSQVEHFKGCANPETCFCEMKRFMLAFICVTVAIICQMWVLKTYTSSYGAEGDISHSLSDDLYYVALVFLFFYKRSHKEKATRADLAGFIMNTILLFIAAGYIIYRLVFGHQTRGMEPGATAVIGLIGLVGNAAQVLVLGAIDWKGSSNIKGVAQHALYDAANSVAVIFDAFINAVVGGMVGQFFDQLTAFLIAISMLWTCWKNWGRIVEKSMELSKG
jgi:cobalt-zinc-cadmium efflux system protein